MVADGEVVEVEPYKTVHNHQTTADEVKVVVSKVYKPTVHAKYGYDIEEGAFTAWDIKDTRIISS